MARYDRSYDFGMRGYQQTTRPLARNRPGYDRAYHRSYGSIDPEYPMPNRVTSSYNRDYVDGAPDYDRDYGYIAGDPADHIGDESYYRRAYVTIGGTRTMRGSQPPRFEPGRYDPAYPRRYRREF